MRKRTRWMVAVIAAAVASPMGGGGPAGAVTVPDAMAVSSQAHASRPSAWVSGNPTFTPPTRKPANIGVNYHAMWSDLSDAGRAALLDRYAGAGIDWVRIDVSWDSIQPAGPNSYDMAGGVAKLSKRLDEVKARGMKSLVMFYWPPKWASGTSAKNGVPRSAAEYGRAAAWLAKYFASKLHAIEIWNEPDLEAFLANRSVVTYTNLLKAAYPMIKAANPNMFVVAGAPIGVNTPWYTQMYAHGGAHMFDALGVHPYIGNTDEPPTACNAKYIRYYPCNIGNLVNLMKAHGDGHKQIWATEYGWSTHNNSTYASPVPSWKRGVTYANQAKYAIQMQQYLARWPQVTNSFWYTDRNTANHDAQEANFGLLYRDFSPKPAYYAMKCVATGICGPRPASAPAPKPAPTPKAPAPRPKPAPKPAPKPTAPKPRVPVRTPKAPAPVRPAPATARVTVTRKAHAKSRARVWSRRLHQHVRARARVVRSASATAAARATTRPAALRIARVRAAHVAAVRAKTKARVAVKHKAHRKAVAKIRRRT